jgi:uncharacterized protein
VRPPRSGDDTSQTPIVQAGDKTLPTPDAALVQLIRTYGPGRFVIGEREWREPVLVSPTLSVPWRVARAEDLVVEALKDLPTVELLVVGCGARSVFLPPPLRAGFKAAGVALEVVDTGAACRIYNVLLAESRKVGAALIPL